MSKNPESPTAAGERAELKVEPRKKKIVCGPVAVRARFQVCYLAQMILDGPDRGVPVERAIEALAYRYGSECDERNRLNQLVGELRAAVEPLGWDVERIGGLPGVNLGRVRLNRATTEACS
jgi:hypothetical protein